MPCLLEIEPELYVFCFPLPDNLLREDYQRVEDLAWHRKHFVCEGCEQLLGGRAYIVTKRSAPVPDMQQVQRS